MTNGLTPSDEEHDEVFWRSQVILDSGDEKASAGRYPRLHNMSPAFMYQAVLRTERPDPVEYVTVRLADLAHTDEGTRLLLAAVRWNMQLEHLDAVDVAFDGS